MKINIIFVISNYLVLYFSSFCLTSVKSEKENPLGLTITTNNGKNITLKLKNVKLPYAKGFFVTEISDKEKYSEGERYKNQLKHMLYRDVDGKSVVVLQNSTNNVRGIISGKYHIWPSEFRRYGSKSKKSLHRLQRIKFSKFIDFERDEGNALKSRRFSGFPGFGNIHSRFLNSWFADTESSVPDKLKVETLFIVSYEFQNRFKKTEYLVQYITVLVSYMNSKYRHVKKPKIVFRLSGIILDSKKDVHNYFRKFRFRGSQSEIDDELSLSEFHTFLRSKINVNFDVGVILTEWDLSYRTRNEISTKTMGIAEREGACDSRLKFTIIEDFGAKFKGSYTLIHEVGHLLGSRHDGSKHNTIARKCPPDQFIMGSMVNKKIFENPMFSECSIKQFQSFAASFRARCLLSW